MQRRLGSAERWRRHTRRRCPWLRPPAGLAGDERDGALDLPHILPRVVLDQPLDQGGLAHLGWEGGGRVQHGDGEQAHPQVKQALAQHAHTEMRIQAVCPARGSWQGSSGQAARD